MSFPKSAKQILEDKEEEFERLAQGLLEYETLTGEEIGRVMRGEPPVSEDPDDDGAADSGGTPSLTAVPKTKPRKKPGGGEMEPEPTA